MADVLLIKLEPDYETHRFAPPFGILYLADALEKAGVKVKLIHKPGTRANIQKIVECVAEEKPLLVGFSSFTGSCLIPTKNASVEIRKKFKIPIVWGGLHPTMLPEETLNNDFIDLVVRGEGEETIAELTALVSERGLDNKSLAGVRGIGFKENGKIVINEPRPFIKNLDDFSPAWQLLDINDYIYSRKYFYTEIGSQLANDRIAAIITSRGCPWRCGYCYNQAVNKRTFRAESVQKVLGEVRDLEERGVTTVIFEDDNFFADRERGVEIIRNIDVSWSSTIRADYIVKGGEDFVKELSENGCLELRVGAESGSPRVLDIIKKDITVEQIRQAVELCSDYKIKMLFNFMVGVPGETWSDVCQTLDFMDELERKSDYVSIGSPAIYIPWPGTFLSELAAKKGFNLPTSLESWAATWAQGVKMAPYMDRRIKFIGFYKSLTRKKFKELPFPFLANLLRKIAVFRWRLRFFSLPLDYYIPAFFLRLLRKIGLQKFARDIYE